LIDFCIIFSIIFSNFAIDTMIEHSISMNVLLGCLLKSIFYHRMWCQWCVFYKGDFNQLHTNCKFSLLCAVTFIMYYWLIDLLFKLWYSANYSYLLNDTITMTHACTCIHFYCTIKPMLFSSHTILRFQELGYICAVMKLLVILICQ